MRVKLILPALAYATGWTEAEPVWNDLIRSGALGRARPALEWGWASRVEVTSLVLPQGRHAGKGPRPIGA
ncbi:MAG: hypothetical protein JKP98_01705 [Rhodobacteraceae bacterium]|nr:hypothetical protein [Paracoccaceae bacterium]